MTARRVSFCMLVGLLVLAPCLGFAAGEPVVHARTRRADHAEGPGGHVARAAWKTTPATPNPAPPVQILSLVGRLSSLPIVIAASPALRPPFVPPRA